MGKLVIYHSCSNWSASLIIAPLKANHIFWCSKRCAPLASNLFFGGGALIGTNTVQSVPHVMVCSVYYIAFAIPSKMLYMSISLLAYIITI